MLALSKRRAYRYTLPIIIGIGFLVVVELAAQQRARVLAKLCEQIEHGSESDTVGAVRRLAAMSNPPIAVLVEAAASEKHATAEAAEVAINRLLEEWQGQVDQQERVGRVASQLTNLAAALAEQRRTFSAANYSWLASATRKVMHLASACPAKQTPLLALHCDEIMSVLTSASVVKAAIADHLEQNDEVRESQAETPVGGVDSASSQRAHLEQTFSQFPAQPIATALVESHQPRQAQSPPIADDAGLSPGNALRHESPSSESGGHSLRTDFKRSEQADVEVEQLPMSGDAAERPAWSLPTYRIPPSTSSHEVATVDRASMPSELEDDPKPTTVAATYSTHELLERWQGANGEARKQIENQLSDRGFDHLSPKLVQQYLSENARDRLRIVDMVMKLPGIDVRPWLCLLAEDEDAEVRLAVVTVMATSADKAVLEKAWQIAIHDRDPRIADLANRLRDLRSGTQLR